MLDGTQFSRQIGLTADNGYQRLIFLDEIAVFQLDIL